MYGFKPEDMISDKIGLTVLYSLIHLLCVCAVSLFICALFQFTLRGLCFAMFASGYITNTFIRTDIREIWRV